MWDVFSLFAIAPTVYSIFQHAPTPLSPQAKICHCEKWMTGRRYEMFIITIGEHIIVNSITIKRFGSANQVPAAPIRL
jgi:hypothetical protein